MRKSMLHLALLALLGPGLASSPAQADTAAAKRHMARGAAAMEMAKSPADFQDAVKEFGEAVKEAPDWADAWFNLGVALESAEDYGAAINSFKSYLKKAPKAADREAVEARIFKLEYKLEKAGRRQEEANHAAVDSLSGHWRKVSLWNTFDMVDGKPRRDGRQWFDLGESASADIQVRGSDIEIKVQLAGAIRIYSGSISGNRIVGRMSERGTRCGPRSNVDFEGEVWPEGKIVMVIASGFCDGNGNQRNDNYRSSHLLMR